MTLKNQVLELVSKTELTQSNLNNFIKICLDLLTLETGDSIWWKWNNTQALITIKLTDYNLISNKKIEIEKCKVVKDGCEQLDANGIARSGVRTFNVKYAGIYYFDIYDGDNITTLTIVATSMQKDHKITITDTEAKPKVLGTFKLKKNKIKVF